MIDAALINEFIAENVTPRYPALRELRVDVDSGNQLHVRVRTSATLIPVVTLQLEVERKAILDPRPTVRFRIRKQGFSGMIAMLLPTFAHKLPPFLRLSAETVEVDLPTLLDQWHRVLALLVSLEIETSPQSLQVALELRA
ncbi:MAG TPA: hypothetical protein VM096_02200 [Vicinamibacterales bacterium]|nr:hypothetical protein [Vicinamibacterales bacterium]